jgi:hypothetical protein
LSGGYGYYESNAECNELFGTQIKDIFVILYNDNFNTNEIRQIATLIDGYKMVDDLHLLHSIEKKDLSLHINYDWHPKIKERYEIYLSGDRELKKENMVARIPFNTEYFIYERDPIDFWEGYYLIFLEDLIMQKKWLNLIHHAMSLLNLYSSWEKDVRIGPFIAMLPGNEMEFAHWVVLLKQDNDGTTYIVSRYPLEHLNEFLVKSYKK